jgi:hypothetical protein
MKYYLKIEQILDEFDVNVPQIINVEVEDREDAESKSEILANLVQGEKTVKFITCRHEE